MNSFGTNFRISVFGESHGKVVGVVIDGCSPGIDLSEEDFSEDIDRRRPGAKGTTTRVEEDIPELLTGIYNGKTTGAPLTILFHNRNVRSSDYEALRTIPRPGHADMAASVKFRGYNDPRGGGHFSGRMTLCLVAAGVVAKKMLASSSISIIARVTEAGGDEDIESALEKAYAANDSIGGIVECIAAGIPVGTGEPFFNSLESMISHMVFSIPAIKGIEFGAGFAAAGMQGSMHNDAIIDKEGRTGTNNAGGITGGIANGNPLVFRVVVKPPSSTPKTQTSINLASGQLEEFSVKGRHDLCIALRVPVVLEAATAIVLADLLH